MKRVQKDKHPFRGLGTMNQEEACYSLFIRYKQRKQHYIVFSFIWLMILSGCINLRAYYDMDTDLIESSYKAADHLAISLPHLSSQNYTVIAASFVNINNLEESSGFGRTVSEYITSRLSQHGFKVKEMKLKNSLFIQKKVGEFILSREIKEISLEHNAGMLLTGTYSVAEDAVYISARMLNPHDAAILAAYEYKLPLGNNNLKMLDTPHAEKKRRFPPGPLENKEF